MIIRKLIALSPGLLTLICRVYIVDGTFSDDTSVGTKVTLDLQYTQKGKHCVHS